MIRTAIAGLGWWGGTLVDSVAESDVMKIVAAFTRSNSDKDKAFCQEHGIRLTSDFDALLGDSEIDAVILATPPSGHRDQIIAAAKAGKHVFCEKPLALTKAAAEAAMAAVEEAGVTIGLGYNRRFHPSWIDLKERIKRGDLGTILHLECSMTSPNGLTLSTGAWRAQSSEAPLGGLFPMGVHAVDGFIDLVGEIDSVFAQSFRRAVDNDNDDTTTVVFRMKEGPSAYLATMMATAPTFRFQVYGSKGVVTLGGNVHVAGQSSHERRSGLFGSYLFQPVKGDAVALEVPIFDVNKAELEAFARAIETGQAFPISHWEMVHGVAATEAIVESSKSGAAVKVA